MTGNSIKLVYFAQVREAIGVDGEDRIIPKNIITVSDCLDWLEQLGSEYKNALGNRSNLRFALDQIMVGSDTAITGSVELAIFPPVTGG